jgi:hypothetical protein
MDAEPPRRAAALVKDEPTRERREFLIRRATLDKP